MFMDPSGNVKNLTFGTTSSGKATLKVAYDVQPQNIVAFCSIIHSQTKAEFTHILVVPAKI